MLRRLALTIPVLLLLLSPAAAQAVGPDVVDPCTVSWNVVTTYTTGAVIPATAPVTYKVYVAPGLVTTVGSPAVATASGLTLPDCTGLAPGQYTGFVTASAGGKESQLSAPFNFNVVVPLIPSVPTGVTWK